MTTDKTSNNSWSTTQQLHSCKMHIHAPAATHQASHPQCCQEEQEQQEQVQGSLSSPVSSSSCPATATSPSGSATVGHDDSTVCFLPGAPQRQQQEPEEGGQWKAGLFSSCFRLGLCHKSVCLACWCPQALVNDISKHVEAHTALKTVSVVTQQQQRRRTMAVFCGMLLFDFLLCLPQCLRVYYDDNNNNNAAAADTTRHSADSLRSGHYPDADKSWGALFMDQLQRREEESPQQQPPESVWIWIDALYGLAAIGFAISTVWSAARLRKSIRNLHRIPSQFWGEDAAAILCCNCCALLQMTLQISVSSSAQDPTDLSTLLPKTSSSCNPDADDDEEEEEYVLWDEDAFSKQQSSSLLSTSPTRPAILV